MKNLFKSVLFALFAFAFVPASHAAGERGTADEAIAMVKKAVAYIKANGREKAFEEINNPKGMFVDRNLYVFVYDLKGVNLAIGNGNAKKMNGKNLMEMKDADGNPLLKNLIEVATTKGSGWHDYKWPNPVNQTLEHKSSYVEKFEDLMVGCGIYKE